MRTKLVTMAITALLLPTTACGNNESTTASTAATRTATTRTTTTTTAAMTTSQGPLAKAIGEGAGIGSPGCAFRKTCKLQFTVTKVTGCTGDGYEGDTPPVGTTRKLVWLDITTANNYDATEAPAYLITDFSAITSDGVSTSSISVSTTWKCVTRADRLGFGDDTWHPGKRYVGAVEVYLPDNATKVVNGDGMWEWALA